MAQQARHERNQHVAVHPERVEGFFQSAPIEALNKSILDFGAPIPKNLVRTQLCCAMIARRSRAPTAFR
jgi:hypothetical protein